MCLKLVTLQHSSSPECQILCVQMAMDKTNQPEIGQLYPGPTQRDPTGKREISIGDRFLGENFSHLFFSVARFGHSSPHTDLVSVQLNGSR